jgi:hypothetical protein
LIVLALGSAACGLQQTGLDGAVAARPVDGAAAAAGTGGAVGSGTTGSTGGSAAATTGGAALGTSGSSGTTGFAGGTSGGTGASSGVVGGGSTGGGSSTTGGATGGATLQQTPGLKGELTIAYTNVTGFDQLGDTFVIKVASTGDAKAQAKAITDYVNAHGGIAGRKVIPKVHDYNAQQASEVNDNNMCQAITETDKAFLAVLQGQIHHSARDCYAAKKTLAFEGAAYGFGKSFYDAHSPYLWSPGYADYDQLSRALVRTIRERKWLAGETKVGLVLWDDKPYHDIADKTLVPLLKAAGVEVQQASVSNSDIGSIENGIHAAAQTMVASQVDHLLFLGSAPLQPFFVQQNQQYEQFKYALTTFDVPRYMAVNFKRNMVGAIGVGIAPVDDVLDPQYAFPQPGLETECRDIYKKAGVDIPGRYIEDVFNSKQAISYCESTLLLKKVADQIPRVLTGAAWTAQAEKLGTSFQAASTFGTSYGPSKHTGATSYRDIVFDQGCGCMKYVTGNRTLP